MKNYLCIDGKRIELTEDQIAEITKSVITAPVKLSDKAVGDTFKIGEYEFIALEHDRSKGTTAAILKGLIGTSPFSDSDCDFKTSRVKAELEAFADKISSVIGTDNLITHTVDLTANDGLKCYGKTTAKMSLLTADLYRQYVEILDNFNPDEWWWLSTPYSTSKHGYTQYVLCVSPRGLVVNGNYDYDYYGVRPFCILNSNIFVS